VSSAPGVITYLEAGTQRIYAFVGGANGHLHVNYWDGSAWHWADQGLPPDTTVSSAPGVITYLEAGTQRIYAFVRGANGHLHVNYRDGSAWHWADQGLPPGTTVSSAPGVITYLEAGTQRIYAFVRGANGHLHVNYWDGSAWHWADQGLPPGTTVPNAPEVITYLEAGTQRIYAFVKGVDGHLHVNYWDGSAWHWADQGQEPTTISVVKFRERFAERLREYNFPAVPDAKTVTAAEFTSERAQQIVDSLPEKSILYLRKGDYFLGAISIDKPLIFLGEDALATKLLFSASSLTSKGDPVWFVNASISYTGNDALMFSLQATNHTVVSYCRLDSTSPSKPWIVQASGRLSIDNSVITIRENATGISVFGSDRTKQTFVELRNCSLMATGPQRDSGFFAFPSSMDGEGQKARVNLERNVFHSAKDAEGAPRFFWVRGQGEPYVQINFNQNVFAGAQPEGLLDLLGGRREDRTIYAPDLTLNKDGYLSPGAPYAEVDGQLMGAIPISRGHP
jgi:hypothetical protein